MFDCVIKGGTIGDSSGQEPYAGGIGPVGQKIIRLGDIDEHERSGLLTLPASLCVSAL